MNAWIKLLDRLLEALLFVAMAIMACVVFTNVVFRYWLQDPFSWGDEVALIMLVWLTYLGAAVGMRDRAHFAFDYLVRNVPSRARKCFVILGHFIVIGMTIALLYWSGEVTIQIREWVTPALEISQAWVYAACPVGSFFILLYALRNLVHDLRAKEVGGAREGQEL